MAVIRVSADFDGEMAHLLRKKNVKFRHHTTPSYTDFIISASHEHFEYFSKIAEELSKGIWVIREPRSLERRKKLYDIIQKYPERFQIFRTRRAFITRRKVLYVKADSHDGAILRRI